MKVIRFLLVSIITIAVTVGLNVKLFDKIPPLGAFLEPFGGFWQNANDEIASLETEIDIKGLQGQVTIQYDQHLIPSIYAENEADLYFAQGFITARHRLWQMELQTRVAAGRLSEVFGEALLEVDRINRRKGLAYGAQNALKSAKKDTALFLLLQKYADGVNAYINSLGKGDLPLEYKMLDYEPEHWSPYKSMLLLKYMADMLSGYETDLENTNILKIWGKDTFDLLFPDRNIGDKPIIPTTHEWDFEPLTVPEADNNYIDALISSVYEKPNPGNGSNNWVVGSGKTADGAPILANDMHLPLNLPSIWFCCSSILPKPRYLEPASREPWA